VIGETGFDVARLLPDPEFRIFSEAAVAALSGGSAAPLREAIARDDTPGRRELAAFAASIQGLAPLLATLRDAGTLPADVAAFLTSERSASSVRAVRLKRTLRESVAALRERGVEVVALKGAALAFFHYAEPSLRPMGDLDLLLREPRDLGRSTEALFLAGWRPLFDTPRHRVFGRPDERVVRPAAEDAENPIRLEIHTSFRLPVLGRVYDASTALRAQSETRDLDGTPVAIAGGSALLTHLLFHAAEDFAGNGIRGIQAYDFRLLARVRGALSPEFPKNPRTSGTPSDEREERRLKEAAPLLFASDVIERLFPRSFEESFLSSISSHVRPALRARAAALPPLRYTRPVRGWTRTLLSLVDEPVPRGRFLLRTLFPTLGEVKANAAPDATGLGLAAAWLRVFVSRAAGVVRPHLRARSR
jgi:hypothetical protein